MDSLSGLSLTSHRGRIRWRLMGWGLGLLALALVSNTISGFIYTRQQLIHGKAELHTEVATTTARSIAELVHWNLQQLETLSSNMATHTLGAKEQETLARLLIKHNPSIAEITLLDDQGEQRFKLSPMDLFSAAQKANQKASLAFIKAIAGENYIGPVLTSERAVPYLTLAVPLRNSPVQVAGAVVARVEVRILWEMIGAISFGRGGYAYVVSDAGVLIAHKDAALVLKQTTMRNSAKLRRSFAQQGADPEPAEIGTGITGEQVLSTYAPLPDLGWVVVVEEPTVLALSELSRLQEFAGLLLALGLLVGAGIITIVSRKLTRPLRELQKDVGRIAAGELSHRATVATRDEVEDLANDFNKMAESLQASYENLEAKIRQRTQTVTTLYELSRAVNQSLELQIIIESVMAKMVEFFGFERVQVFLLNEQSEEFCLQAVHEPGNAKLLVPKSFKAGEGVVGRVGQSGEPLIFEDVRQDPRYAALSSSKVAKTTGIRFLAVFPIKTPERTYGTIVFDSLDARVLREGELRLLNAIFEHIGVAVEKARLFERIKEQGHRLAQLNEELQAANRAKSGFIAAVSHDLRTPLNIMIGNADLGKSEFFGALDADYKQAFSKISHHGRMVLKMVNDMLTLSRFEAKKMSLDVAPVALGELIEQAKSHVEYANRDKKLSVQWEVDGNLPELVTDPIKLEEILQNLIGNAFKFTPAGGITVRVRNREARVEFSVADTGIGIAPENVDKIFDEFEQVNKSRTGNHSGAGLGLAIVKKYLDLMQGDIAVESAPGQGSKFTFSLPHSVDLHS